MAGMYLKLRQTPQFYQILLAVKNQQVEPGFLLLLFYAAKWVTG
jgi:hypothetical protein